MIKLSYSIKECTIAIQTAISKVEFKLVGREMDILPFTKTPEYREAIRREGEFWGIQLEETLKYGIPFRVDFRFRTKIQRPKYQGEYSDDPVLFDIVMGKEFMTLIQLVKKYSIKNKKVLELGCGAGGLSLELARSGLNVTGIDVSHKSIEVAKHFLMKNKNFKDNFGNLTYEVADLNLITFEPNHKYDVVYSNGGLHHVFNFENLLKKVNNVLYDEGYFIFYDNIGETKISKALGHFFEKCRSKTKSTKLDLLKYLVIFIGELKNFLKTNKYETPDFKKLQIEKGPPSPFEGVTTSEILEILPKHFKILYEYHCQCFVKIIAHNIYWLHKNNKFTYFLIYILKKIDQLLCFFKIYEGENVLIVAKKMLRP